MEKDELVINLEINSRKIILSHIVWNNETNQYIGYDSTGDNIIVCGIHHNRYDIFITTNKAIPAYTE